ncbi:VanZ family protein [uncultured Aureimonas sp.]|uniref:VanZ family protein n=1 Tax=uncultured Aureimonas sp. TaxID=1604662 RepID=UPI0025E9CDE0|nr:VanZ family protein [uncultured Aureimonas sp.]
MTQRILRLAAWLALAAILFVTVSPIGLRPHDVMPVDLDRALAFVVMTALFALAYPKRWLAVGLTIIVGAFAIELLQELSPTRHARLDDALVKAGGAFVGLCLARLVLTVHPRRASRGASRDVPARTLTTPATSPEAPAR